MPKFLVEYTRTVTQYCESYIEAESEEQIRQLGFISSRSPKELASVEGGDPKYDEIIEGYGEVTSVEKVEP
jgi:hypothetical protein